MNQLKIENMVINYDGQQITFDDQDRQKYSFKLKNLAASYEECSAKRQCTMAETKYYPDTDRLRNPQL